MSDRLRKAPFLDLGRCNLEQAFNRVSGEHEPEGGRGDQEDECGSSKKQDQWRLQRLLFSRPPPVGLQSVGQTQPGSFRLLRRRRILGKFLVVIGPSSGLHVLSRQRMDRLIINGITKHIVIVFKDLVDRMLTVGSSGLGIATLWFRLRRDLCLASLDRRWSLRWLLRHVPGGRSSDRSLILVERHEADFTIGPTQRNDLLRLTDIPVNRLASPSPSQPDIK